MPEPTTGFIASFLANTEGAGRFTLAFGGLLGGIISLRFDNSMNRWQRITAVITSMVLGDIGGQPLADLFAGGKFAGGSSVMIGLFWLVVFGTAIKGLRQLDIAAIANSWFSRRP